MYQKLAPIILSGLLIMASTAQARSSNILKIDDFSGTPTGDGVPRGWDLKENEGSAWIRVVSENGNNALHLISNKSSFTLKKELEIDLKKYPIFSWRWKVVTLPRGGDVRNKEKDDQAAQIYLHFAKFPQKLNFWEIGYIWDTLTPQGNMLPSQQPVGSKVQYVVIQSGPQKLGQWITEQRNVYQDHKMLFGEDPTTKLLGIGLMIDSDNTNSSAECYIDDLVFKKY